MNGKYFFAVLAVFLALAVGVKAQERVPLKQVATIPLPGLKDGDFDHFTADVDGHRMFLTAEENNKVVVFDTKTNQVIHIIDGLQAPKSIAYRKDLKKMFIMVEDAAVRVYDTETYKPVSEIKVAEDADSSTYDPVTKYLYAVNGGKGAKMPNSFISVIDTSTSKKLRDINMPTDYVEAMALEKSGPRIFINMPGLNAVGVLDRKKFELTGTWPLPADAKRNVAMAFDEADHRLFVITRDPGKLVVFNSDDGKVVTELPAVSIVDEAVYDAKNKRVYVAGDQFLDVFQLKDPDHYELLAKIPGSFRAKTGILVPELNRYYLAVPHHENKEAEVRIYEVQP